jgi:hypothetical protein
MSATQGIPLTFPSWNDLLDVQTSEEEEEKVVKDSSKGKEAREQELKGAAADAMSKSHTLFVPSSRPKKDEKSDEKVSILKTWAQGAVWVGETSSTSSPLCPPPPRARLSVTPYFF